MKFVALAIAVVLPLFAGTASAQETQANAADNAIVGEIEQANGCAVDDQAAFDQRRQRGADTESRMSLGAFEITLYPRLAGDETADGALPMEYIVIARKGECEHIIADANAFIVWARPALPDGYTATDPSPLAILSSYSGGAHCCTTLYALYPGKELKLQVLNLGNAEATLTQEWAGGAPSLSFGDDSFAYWNSSYAGSPGGGVSLDWSPEGYRLSDSMRGDAPDAAALATMHDEIRAALTEFGGPYTAQDATGDIPQPKGELDPVIWGYLLELIYAGHADLAVKLFDTSWPAEVKGKRAFWRDFVKQMEATWIWTPWDLKDQLDPEMKFESGE